MHLWLVSFAHQVPEIATTSVLWDLSCYVDSAPGHVILTADCRRESGGCRCDVNHHRCSAEEHLAKLNEMARQLGVMLEQLMRASIKELLTRLEADFEQAVDHVLTKKAELYRRLA